MSCVHLLCDRLKQLWLEWPGHEIHLRFLTLRFKDPAVEAGFLKMRKASLIRNMRLVAVLAVLLALSWCMHDLFVGNYDRAAWPSEEAYAAFGITTLCFGVIFVTGLAFVLSLSSQALVECTPTCVWEVASTLVVTLSMATLVLTQPTNLLKAMRYEPEEGRWAPSDAQALLLIDGAVSGVHFGLPIRWLVLVILEVSGISLYAAIVFVVGSQEQTPLQNLALLSGLVLVASLSKRAAEIRERKSFSDLLAERSMRCEAEFELSRAHDVRARDDARSDELRSEARPSSQAESLPRSTATGEVFNQLYQNGVDVHTQLAKVARIAEQEHWRIGESEVKLVRDGVLGRGSFGQVRKGIFYGTYVAVKLPFKMGGLSQGSMPDLCNEMRVLRHLRHANIVCVHGVIVEPAKSQFALVMELVNGVPLDSFIPEVQETSLSTPDMLARCKTMIGVCCALMYMHARTPRIVHGDLKPSNILVETGSDDFIRPRILDFGLSRVLTRNAMPLGGSVAWTAPEVLRGQGVRECGADVYSLGHVVAFTCTGIKPFAGLSYQEALAQLRRGSLPVPSWPQPGALRATCKPLAARCLAAEARDRPTAQKVHEELLPLLESLALEMSSGDQLPNTQQSSPVAEAPDQEGRWELPSGDQPATTQQSSPDAEAPQETALGEAQGDCNEAAPASNGEAAQAAVPAARAISL